MLECEDDVNLRIGVARECKRVSCVLACEIETLERQRIGCHIIEKAGFELLVANDPTYKLPSFGGYELVVPAGSACIIDARIGAGAKNDVPPGYYDATAVNTPRAPTPTDAFFAGSPAGGSAEFDLLSSLAGTCAVNVVETTGLRRTFNFSIPIL